MRVEDDVDGVVDAVRRLDAEPGHTAAVTGDWTYDADSAKLALEAWVPLFLFGALFGLSKDYQVFLLSRIRERYVRTLDNKGAVAFGVGSTARLITGAALIIIAVALLIDATLVRGVLVPATMRLLGDWNWYLPSWLLSLPDPHVEGTEESVTTPSAVSSSISSGE